MKYLDIAEVQKYLLTLLDEIAIRREEVMITCDGIGVAMILPCEKTKPEASQYPLRGLPIQIVDDFDQLVGMTGSPLLPLAAIAGVTVSTIVVWHQGDRSYK